MYNLLMWWKECGRFPKFLFDKMIVLFKLRLKIGNAWIKISIKKKT